jgi:YidC/Oxa1 family membrane protein insertase
MNAFFDKVLFPLEWVVANLMVGFHKIFTFLGFDPTWGITWALSIVGLTIVIRVLLIPLFVKQIHASRRMQLIQPEMQKIQKKYKGKTDPESRQAMTQETMGLYKSTGTNPLSSCLPVLLQSPVFFALFRVLNNLAGIASGTHPAIGPLDKPVAAQANASTIFTAPLSATFKHTLVTGSPLPIDSSVNTKIVCVVMIILMSASTFTSMRQLMMKNMPAGSLDNPAGKMQKNMMYLMPLMFIFSGVTFAIGVLLYWLTTNLWSMGQQFYTIRRMPAPGSPAELALAARRKKSGKEHKKFSIPGLNSEPDAEEVQDLTAETKPKSGQRQQPKRKNRGKPVGQNDGSAGTTPAGATSAGATPPGPNPPGAKPPGAKPSGAKPPGAKPPGAKRPGAKPAATVDGDA